jgi:cytochrome P450
VEQHTHLRRPPGPSRRRNLIESAIGFTTDPLGFVGNRFRKYGDVYYVPNAKGGFYVMRHPEQVHAVLVTHAAKMRKEHSAFELLSRVVGEGLLTTDGDVWRRQRRMLQPAFTQARLAAYAGTMVEETARVRDSIRAGSELEVSREMMELTLRVVCRTLFSHDVTGETNEVARAMVVLQDSVSRPDLLPQWLPTPHRRRFRDAVSAIDRIVFDMIRERRRATNAPPDLLQSLVTAVDEEGGVGLSEREVRDQLVTLFLAGHETTSHALTWTWYLLSQNPAAERALHEELDRVVGDRLPKFDDPLPYTEQVIKEAMRIYPPVYLLARRTAEEVELGGYSIPMGTELVLWVYQTQHDPRWFPEPEAFRPERFTPENEARLPKGAYVPFGAGPRVCIGKTFAMMEARLLLATIAQRYRLELVPGHRVAMRPRVTLNPKHGMRMIARSRK